MSLGLDEAEEVEETSGTVGQEAAAYEPGGTVWRTPGREVRKRCREALSALLALDNS